MYFKNLQSNKIVLLEDFNIPNYKKFFDDFTVIDYKIRLLNLFSESLELKQINHVQNSLNRLLNLVFVNFNALLEKCLTPIFCEDKYHPSLIVSFSLKPIAKNKTIPSNLKFERFNWKLCN